MKVFDKNRVTNTVQSSLIEDVESIEEADVIIKYLETSIGQLKTPSISAPEVNINKKVAIIRSSTGLDINLINPIVVEMSEYVLSCKEPCSSELKHGFNCVRRRNITIMNGFSKELIKFTDKMALLVQHELDHLYGRQPEIVRAMVVRQNGEIMENKYCYCASKLKFKNCCMGKK